MLARVMGFCASVILLSLGLQPAAAQQATPPTLEFGCTHRQTGDIHEVSPPITVGESKSEYQFYSVVQFSIFHDTVGVLDLTSSTPWARCTLVSKEHRFANQPRFTVTGSNPPGMKRNLDISATSYNDASHTAVWEILLKPCFNQGLNRVCSYDSGDVQVEMTVELTKTP